jgi:hypothetical protein
VGQVGIAQKLGRLTCQGRGDHPVAEHGLGATKWPEVVRRPADGHADAAPVCGLQGSASLAPWNAVPEADYCEVLTEGRRLG